MYEPMYVDSCIVVFVICIICVYGHIYKYVFPIMLKLINYDHCNYQNNFNTILIQTEEHVNSKQFGYKPFSIDTFYFYILSI